MEYQGFGQIVRVTFEYERDNEFELNRNNFQNQAGKYHLQLVVFQILTVLQQPT